MLSADGELQFCLLDDSCGGGMVSCTANFETILSDDGGVENEGQNSSRLHSFSLTVFYSNRAPEFDISGDITVLENSEIFVQPEFAFNISVGGPDEAYQNGTFIVSLIEGDVGLFARFPEISPNGTLTFLPQTDMYGNATLNVTLVDDGGVLRGEDTSESIEFVIEILHVNVQPAFELDVLDPLPQNAPPFFQENFAFEIEAGPPSENWQNVTFEVVLASGDSSIFISPPAITVNGTLSFETKPYREGTALFNVTLVDDGGWERGGINTSDVRTLNVTVIYINHAPTFTLPEMTLLATGVIDASVDWYSFNTSVAVAASDSVELVGHALSLNAEPILRPNIMQTRLVDGHLPGSPTLSISAPFDVFRIEGSLEFPEANALFYPYSRSAHVDARFAYRDAAHVFFLYHTAAPTGPCAGGFAWIMDGENRSDMPLGAARAAVVASGGGGFVDGDVLIQDDAAFIGTFSVDSDGGIANATIHSASEGLPAATQAVLVYPGTRIEQNATVTKLVYSNSHLDISEITWHGCADSVMMVVNGSSEEIARVKFNVNANGSASWEMVSHGSGYTAAGTVLLEDQAADAACRCGSMLTAVRAYHFGENYFDAHLVLPDESDELVAVPFLWNATGNETAVDFGMITVLRSDWETLKIVRIVDASLNETGSLENASFPLLDTCNRSAGTDVFRCGSGALLELVFGLPPGMCLEAVVASGGIVSIVGDNSSVLQLCTDSPTPFTPHRAGQGGSANVGWWERAANGTFLSAISRGYVVRSSPPFAAPAKFTVRAPGNVTFLEEAVEVEGGIIQDIDTGEAGQTAEFNATLLRGDLALCGNINLSSDGNVSVALPRDLVGACDLELSLRDSGGTVNGGNDLSHPYADTFETSWQFSTLGCPALACGTILRVQVTGVNDPPRLSLAPVVRAPGYVPGIQDVWNATRTLAVNVSGGPPDEADQEVTIEVDDGGSELFESEPLVRVADGVAVVELNLSAFRSTRDEFVVFNITARDNGGVEDGGQDTTTLLVNFSIALVTAPPNFTISELTVAEGSHYDDAPQSSRAVELLPNDLQPETLFGLEFAIIPAQMRDMQLLNAGVFSLLPEISSTGALSFTLDPASMFHGAIDFNVTASNNGSSVFRGRNTSDPKPFRLVVTPVNEPPSFSLSLPLTPVNENSGAHIFPGFVFNISTGDRPNEAQNVTFNVSYACSMYNDVSQNETLENGISCHDDAESLFAEDPYIYANGTLTFALAQNLYGNTTFAVTATDDAGGRDTSEPVLFNITVLFVNMEPSFDLSATSILAGEDSDECGEPFPFCCLGGKCTFEDFAVNISAGPPNEAEDGQELSFEVVQTAGLALFEEGPKISSDGTLTWRLRHGSAGNFSFNVTLRDSGGTDRGGTDTSRILNFTLEVEHVNDAPAFQMPSLISVLEDSPCDGCMIAAFNISAGPSLEAEQLLTFSTVECISENEFLFKDVPTLSPLGELSYKLNVDQNGGASCTFLLRDNGGTLLEGEDESAEVTMNFTVTAVNDPPVFTLISNPSFSVNGYVPGVYDVATFGPTVLAVSVAPGPIDEADQLLTLLVDVGSHGALFSTAPTVTVTDGNAMLSFVLAPLMSSNGTYVELFLSASDGGGTENGGNNSSSSAVFSLLVGFVNFPPEFTLLGNVTVAEGSGAFVAPFAAFVPHPAKPNEQVTYSVVLSSVLSDTGNADPGIFLRPPAILPDGNVTFELKPLALQRFDGDLDFDVTASNDGGTALGARDTSDVQQFTLTISFVNQPPSFELTEYLDPLLQNSGAHEFRWFAFGISTNDPRIKEQELTFELEMTDGSPSLFEVMPQMGPNGTLSFTLAPHQFGTATFSVTLRDSGGGADTSETQQLDIEVLFVNEAPTFSLASTALNLLEDAVDCTTDPQDAEGLCCKAAGCSFVGFALDIAAGPSNSAEEIQTLSFTAVVDPDTSALFATPPHVDPKGTLAFVLALDANGDASIRLTLRDSGGTARGGADTSVEHSFAVSVTAVNDAPSFRPIADRFSALQFSGESAVAYAADITAGPTDEAPQAVSFSLTQVENVGTSHTELFSALPTVDAGGVLRFDAAEGAAGSATFEVVLSDDGGTSSGGSDAAAPRELVIEIAYVNQAPSFDLASGAADREVGDGANVHDVAKGKAYIVDLTGADVTDRYAEESSISAGPSVEASQSVTFVVEYVSGDVSLVSPPELSDAGALSFQTKAGTIGDVAFTVWLVDDGGTLNGGRNRSLVAKELHVRVSSALLTIPITFPDGYNPSAEDLDALRDLLAEFFGLPVWALQVTTGSTRRRLLAAAAQVLVSYSALDLADSVEVQDTLVRASQSGLLASLIEEASGQSAAEVGGISVRVAALEPREASMEMQPNVTVSHADGLDVSVPGFVYDVQQSSDLVLEPYQGYYWTFDVTNVSNPSLFSVFPSISFKSGVLRFSLSPGRSGMSVVSFDVIFPAGTLLFSRTFTIHVAAENAPPAFELPWNAECFSDSAACVCGALGSDGTSDCAPAPPGELPTVQVVSSSGAHLVESFAVGVSPARGFLLEKRATLVARRANGTRALAVERMAQQEELTASAAAYAADVVRSPDGAHYYAAEFATDSLAVFAAPPPPPFPVLTGQVSSLPSY